MSRYVLSILPTKKKFWEKLPAKSFAQNFDFKRSLARRLNLDANLKLELKFKKNKSFKLESPKFYPKLRLKKANSTILIVHLKKLWNFNLRIPMQI